MKKLSNTQKLTLTGAMVALSFVLTFFEIPFNPVFGLKIDFADVPVVIATLVAGPLYGIGALILKLLLGMLRNPAGWTFNFAAGLFYLLPIIASIAFIQKAWKKNENIALSITLTIATLFVTLMATLTNYLVLIPLLFPSFQLDFAASFAAYAPFNLVKFALVSVVSFIIYQTVKRFYH